MDDFQLESKVCEILPTAVDTNLKDGSDASDIERISDDGMEVYNMEASVLSQASSFSLVSVPAGAEADMESLASSSSISVIQDDENGDLSAFGSSKDEMPEDLDATRVRTYTHTPNTKLNFALNLLLALSVTMVVGLGIGHFIGWSSRWMNQHNFQQAHIMKLKALQEELVNCLQNPGSHYMEGNGESKACYEKVDYWQEKFDDILSQNDVLQNFIDRSIHENLDEQNDEKCEETNQNIIAEYRQLKFHLITQQLENVATLRRMEALKRQEKETLDRVKRLEEENEELKAQVEDEQVKDSTSDEDADRELIQQLSEENQELKKELNHLMAALKLEQQEDDKKSVEELGCLREQINQLKIANSELQQVIAKLRYGQPSSKENVEEVTQSEEEDMETAKDDSVLHSWFVDNMKDVNLTGFFEYLIKVAMDKDAARRELKQLQENLKLSYEQLSEKAKIGIDTGKTILSEIQQSFHSKLQQIMQVNASDSLSVESIRKIGKTLKNTIENLYTIGSDMLAMEDAVPLDNNESKFRKKVDKLLANFGKQWESVKAKMWGETVKNKPRSERDAANGKKEQATKFDSAMEKDPVSMKEKSSKYKQKENSHRNIRNANRKSNRVNNHSTDDKLGSKKKDGQKKKSSDFKIQKHPPIDQKEHKDDPPKTKFKNLSNNKNSHISKPHEHSYQPDKVDKKNKMNMKSQKNRHDKTRPKEFNDDKISNKQHKQSTPKWSKTRTNNNKKNYTYNEVPSENSADWVFKRADERVNNRKNEQQSDWLFDRAHYRQQTRKNSERANWYFEKMRRNEDKQHDYTEKKSKSKSFRRWDVDDDDDDDDSEEEDQKIRQKRLKKRKTVKNVEDRKQWSNDEESDDEIRETRKQYKYQRHSSHHSYQYDWTFSNPSYSETHFY